MRCFYPIALKESKLVVPCGRCLACRMRRRSDWTLRLLNENETANTSAFITLTYNDTHLPNNGNLDKPELIKYLKRVRSKTEGLKYYCIGEYGDSKTDNLRPHYHGIVYNAEGLTLLDKWKDEEGDEIGNVVIEPVTNADIHYVTKYISNTDDYGVIEVNEHTGKTKYGLRTVAELGNQQPFAIMSKGIGKSYIEKMRSYHLKNLTRFTNLNGKKLCLPRYYQDKIFDTCKNILLEEENEEIKKKNEEQLLKTPWEKRAEAKAYYEHMSKKHSKSKKI